MKAAREIKKTKTRRKSSNFPVEKGLEGLKDGKMTGKTFFCHPLELLLLDCTGTIFTTHLHK